MQKSIFDILPKTRTAANLLYLGAALILSMSHLMLALLCLLLLASRPLAAPSCLLLPPTISAGTALGRSPAEIFCAWCIVYLLPLSSAPVIHMPAVLLRCLPSCVYTQQKIQSGCLWALPGRYRAPEIDAEKITSSHCHCCDLIRRYWDRSNGNGGRCSSDGGSSSNSGGGKKNRWNSGGGSDGKCIQAAEYGSGMWRLAVSGVF